jgi:dCTP deaminase
MRTRFTLAILTPCTSIPHRNICDDLSQNTSVSKSDGIGEKLSARNLICSQLFHYSEAAMYLSAQAIVREVEEARLAILPFDKRRLKPASYVLSLGSRHRRWKKLRQSLKPWSQNAAGAFLEEPVEGGAILLHPGQLVLGCTTEKIALSRLLFAVISPLSHIARFGLTVNGGADFANPGFGEEKPSELTLELANLNESPIELTIGMPIAHLRIGRIDGDVSAPPRERSVYEGADPVSAPQLYEEWASSGLGLADV